MSLKKTACLASMLLSFPLAAPSMSVAEDFDPNKDIETAGEAISSGTKDSPQTATLGAGPYDNVYIGHAVINGANVVGSAEANWNKGEIDKAVTVNGHIYGGSASFSSKSYVTSNIATEANGNTLILKKGSSIEMTFADKIFDFTTFEFKEVGPDIYAGYANGGEKNFGGWADANANENTVIIEDGASLKHTKGLTVNIYGGYAYSPYGVADTAASHNKVTINEGATIEASLSVRVGYAKIPSLKNNNSGDVTASYNELNVRQASVTFAGCEQENDLTIGYAFNKSSGKAVASNNTGTLEGENIVINGTVTVRSGFAQHTDSEGEAYANENRLTISGVKFVCETNKYSIYTGRAWGRGKVYANGNITSIASVDNKGDIAGGYAEGYYYFDSSPVTNTYANNNITTITDSTMYIARAGFARFGAYAEAEGNRLSMSGGSVDYAFAGDARTNTYFSTKAYTCQNDLILQNMDSGMAFGGYSVATSNNNDTAAAQENTLSVYGGSSSVLASAGYAISNNIAEATGNRVYLNYDSEQDKNLETETTIKGSLYGGYAAGKTAKASDNKGKLVNAVFSDEENGKFAGGFAKSTVADGSAEASDNIFAAEGGTYTNVYGGQAVSSVSGSSATAEGNELALSGAEVSATLYGGYAESIVDTATDAEAVSGAAAANSNTLFMYGGTYNGDIYGGYASSTNGTADSGGNTISMDGGTYDGDIYGGYSKSSSSVTADKNDLTVNGAEIHKMLYGGYAESIVDTATDAEAVSGAAAANSNTLSLYGGTYGDDIYGGYASSTNSTAEAAGNTVGLYALDETSPSFSTSTVIWGGYASAGGTEVASTDNTLSFNDVNGMTAANIKNFQNLIFTYATTTLATNDVVMTLTGGDDKEKTTIADGGKISVSVRSLKGEDSDIFALNDRVYLLKNENGLDIETENLSLEKNTVKTGSGILECQIELEKDENSLYLTNKGVKAAPETKSIAEGALSGLALASEAAESVFEVINELAEQDIFTFGTAHASNMTYESGSKINLSSVSVIAGLGKGFDTDAGYLSVGAFFEYGKGSYTTHNSFDDRGDINGDGNSWYMGGGILGKMIFKDTGPGHFYVEGSAHMGTVHNEFNSNDFTDDNGNVAKFDMDSPYYSLHGGLGYVWNMAEDHELKVYGKYIWTMVQGTDDTLTTNAKFDYDDMHSNRVRGGVRYSYTGNDRFKPYVGVAYEHEFAGSCDSRAYGHDVNSPSYEGDTGIGELGILMTPSDTLPLSFNLGVQGSVGKKQGISGTFNMVFEF